MRLLVAAPRLAPDYNPEAICTTNLLRAIAPVVEHISVVTSTTHSTLSDLENVTVYVVPDYEAETLVQKTRRLFHMFPEDGFSWAVRAAKLVSRLAQKVDLVYSRGLPFASHLTVFFANLPPHQPWVAHFSDPWPQWPESEFWADSRGWRYAWHKKLLQCVTGITFSTDQVGEVCRREQWGKRSVPYATIPHVGLGPLPPAPDKVNDVVSVLHTGTLYGARKPDNLLCAWAQFVNAVPERREKFKLTHVGPESAEISKLSEHFGITDCVTQLGLVPPDTAKQMQRDATYLLLVENQESRTGIYLPSKLIDYLWANRPILALTPPNGVVSSVLGSDYKLKAAPWDIAEIVNSLNCMANSRPSDFSQQLSHCRKGFEASSVVDKLLKFLSGVITNTDGEVMLP